MSDLATSLNGASFDGLVRVEELRAQGMITLRGDFADADFVAAVTQVAEVTMPGLRGAELDGKRGLLWMSPDELLMLCTYAEAPILVAKLERALVGHHSLVANVSDARACFTLQGQGLREVLAKLAPVDMSRGQFEIGDVRRTRLAQVAAAFWLRSEDVAQVVCFRSVGAYMFHLLATASAPGSDVGFL
ncbi:MAG: sarcosine oxidase subunit gamma [Pelagimonas sp.]|uniref:sarcosine oxidase subunit gamma n=1 Tax=Pelagimonas sp. TaxID=2073170 RepID=UPI003D6A9630